MVHASGGAARDALPNARRHPGQEADYEVQWKVLHVDALSPQACSTNRAMDDKGVGTRFRIAVPAQIGAAHAAAAGPASTENSAAGRVSLHPDDIPRARLFLCHEADVAGSMLPRLHVEIDPCVNLSVAVEELKKISRSSAASKPHSGHHW
jgi:hypothetical protein